MTTTTATVHLERRGPVARLVIDNVARRNAMSLTMWRDLAVHCREIGRSDARVVVLTGAGPAAFCAGADISEFADQRSSTAAIVAYDAAVAEANAALSALPVPAVAVIEGACYGGGFGLAMACDVRLASETARFRIPAGRLGLGYPYATVRDLVHDLGPATVADLLFSARVVGAAEANAMGIVQAVWSQAEFAERAGGYVEDVAANAPLTLRAIKAALREIARPEAERDPERVDRAVAACFGSEDYTEGQRAFRERRQPKFEGR